MHALTSVLILLLGCSSGSGDRLGGAAADPTPPPVCSGARVLGGLPDDLDESSGLAYSVARPNLLWSHDDSGAPPVLFAMDTLGRVRARVRVAGARNVDWEDIAAGPCPAGGSCLWIADTGNNDGDRRDLIVYRVPEPDAGDSVSQPASSLVIRYADGPHDTEAIAVSPKGALYLVTKGSLGRPRYVFMVPRPTADGVNVPRPVARLGGPRPLITGAAMSPDGEWLGIRTYDAVRFFRVEKPDSLVALGADGGIPLTALAESQGEAIAIRADGTVFLSSEAGHGRPAQLARMTCTFPR